MDARPAACCSMRVCTGPIPWLPSEFPVSRSLPAVDRDCFAAASARLLGVGGPAAPTWSALRRASAPSPSRTACPRCRLPAAADSYGECAARVRVVGARGRVLDRAERHRRAGCRNGELHRCEPIPTVPHAADTSSFRSRAWKSSRPRRHVAIAVTPSTVEADAAGGEVSVTLTAPGGCTWRARSDTSWVSRTVPAEGTGSATVRLTVAPNTGELRRGTVTIAGVTVQVRQAGPARPRAHPGADNRPPADADLQLHRLADPRHRPVGR